MVITISPRLCSTPAVIAAALPKLRRKRTSEHPRVGRVHAADLGHRAVVRAVVDVDDLEAAAGPFEGGDQAAG